MRNTAFVCVLIAMLALSGPAFSAEKSWELIRLKDGRMVVGTVTDATNRAFVVTLMGRTESLPVSRVLTIAPKATNLEAGVHFIAEARRSGQRGNANRSMQLLKTGLRLLRDYVPVSSREATAHAEGTARGYLLGGKMLGDRDQWKKARDAYRHILARYPKTVAAASAKKRLAYATARIERKKRNAAKKEVRSINWDDLFGKAFPPPPKEKPEKNSGKGKPGKTTKKGPSLADVRKKVGAFFPLKAGNWWKYRIGKSVEVMKIDSETKSDKEIVFGTTTTVTTGKETVTQKGLLVLTRAGLFRREGKMDEPILLFPIVFKKNSAYNYERKQGETTFSWRYAAHDVRVTLPPKSKARKREFVKCLDIEVKTVIHLGKSDLKIVSHQFYAPGVGLIQVALNGEGAAEKKVLVDFKVGK